MFLRKKGFSLSLTPLFSQTQGVYPPAFPQILLCSLIFSTLSKPVGRYLGTGGVEEG